MVDKATKTIYSRKEIEEVHDTLTFLVKTLASQPEQDGWRKAVATMRGIDYKLFEEHYCFFIPDIEYLISVIGEKYYTDMRLGLLNNQGQSALNARFMFPCFNSKGKVVGLVGYDNLSKNYKYILTSTLGFEKSKVTYGYQDLEVFYREQYVILVEGVMEYFRLKSLGYPVFCIQGVLLYPTHVRMLKRIPNLIRFLDSDNAGFRGSEDIGKLFKASTDIQLKRYGLSKLDPDTFLSYKENVDYFRYVIKHIKSSWEQLNYSTLLLSNYSPELKERMDKALEEKRQLEKQLMEEKGVIENDTNNANKPNNTT